MASGMFHCASSPFILLLLLCVQHAQADVYLHHPRGSNNKLHETSNTRTNANRLFDSQNNANGGYNVGDNCIPACSDANNNYDVTQIGAAHGSMHFFVGSTLYVEWTAQHGCGTDKTNCDVILQYMCDSPREPGERQSIRDGYTTNTIPFDPLTSTYYDYGMHESYEERNKGLFLADQFTNNELITKNTAIYTRQDDSGTRYAFECPEERDYYPYWHPTPWKDVAILTDDLSRCDYYRSESQNVKAKGECSLAQYNNKASCTGHSGTWSTSSHHIDPPLCLPAQATRDNHLGNTLSGAMASFNWTIPNEVSEACILRLRYNISTNDYKGWGAKKVTVQNINDASPIKDTPVKDWIGLGEGVSGPLRLAINSDQLGRTFQDRSHLFQIRKCPSGVNGPIYNLNVRGRRGNIQQVYPAVEYDFVPNTLTVKEGEHIHFQWTGADSNPNGNTGEGRSMTDRSNLVEIANPNTNFPIPFDRSGLFNGNAELVAKFAFLGQTGCDNTTTNDDSNSNCKVLNAASAYFDGGLVQMKNVGTFYYMNTRNHQFSNRSQKGKIIVQPFLPGYAIAALSIGGLVVVGAAAAFGVSKASTYMALHPASKLATSKFGKVLQKTNKILPFAAAAAYGSQEDEKEPRPPSKYAEFWAREKFRIMFMTGYVTCNIGFFFYGFLLNLNGPSFYFSMAKGGGALLNFNCSLILFPILRNMISWLRLTPLGDVVPLDDNINFHKIIATSIGIAGLIHMVGHYMNYSIALQRQGTPIASQALGSYYGITGHLLLLLMFFVFVTAATSIKSKTYRIGKRKIGGYDIFWMVHHLYIPIFVLLWIHGPRFFMWSFYPILLFIIEKFIRRFRSREKTQVVRVIQHASDVLCIQMRKRDFHYKAGQYVYLNCPEISKTEWHPFTITSAPEEDFFSVHIRCRGDWTSSLRNIFNPNNQDVVEFVNTVPEPMPMQDGDGSTKINVVSHPVLKTDGAYGSASEHVFNHEVVMLIGTGIGVTPFASIMKSISIRLRRSAGNGVQVPKKVYFYWICGDEQEFNWFKYLLQDIDNDPTLKPIISLNTFMTGELNLQEMMAKGGSTNMKYAGRPNWMRIFKEQQKNHDKQEIGVFFCGPVAMAQDLSRMATQSSSMQGTRFIFRKENF